jgi:hypothetical protein
MNSSISNVGKVPGLAVILRIVMYDLEWLENLVRSGVKKRTSKLHNLLLSIRYEELFYILCV